MATGSFFATKIYHTKLFSSTKQRDRLNSQLRLEVEDIADQDAGGRRWSSAHYKNGFTSYGSANELHRTSSTFGDLEKALTKHAELFAKELELDLGGTPLRMNNCWVNVMGKNSHHSGHIHPLAILSGTYYLDVPKGASPIKFEDPRLGYFMGAPPRRADCSPANQPFVEIRAVEGDVVLFESWLRHEVPLHTGRQNRVSISFNFAWGD